MTRSRGSRPLTPDPLAEYDDLRRGSGLIGNMVLFFVLLGLGAIIIYWMLSDISGEYQIPGRGPEIRMSLVRQPTNVWGELSFGPGAILRLITTDPPQTELVKFTFETPSKWLKGGQKPRRVSFVGTLKEGVLNGKFFEGTKVVPVHMERNPYTSVYRQIEAHLPWQLWQRYLESQQENGTDE